MPKYTVVFGTIYGKSIGETVELSEDEASAYGEEYVVPAEEEKAAKKPAKNKAMKGNESNEKSVDNEELPAEEEKAAEELPVEGGEENKAL